MTVGLCEWNILQFDSYIIMEATLNISHIAEALTAIHSKGASSDQIHTANSFLRQCEEHPDFSLFLLNIYSQTQQPQLQLSSLLLLTNVIKRTWVNRGRNLKTPLPKDSIKQEVIKACLLHNMNNYKHFNALLRVMARQNYPSQYLELHNFILSSLQGITELAQGSAQNLVQHGHTVPVLSICKGVLKQYSNKRIAHKEQDFRNFSTAVISAAVNLSQTLENILKEIFSTNNINLLIPILQFIRKADKIVLYGILTMPSNFQTDPDICLMVQKIVAKVKEFDQILPNNIDPNMRVEIQKYLIGMIQLLTKAQHNFAFTFSPFLKDYLSILMTMMFNNIPKSIYSHQKLLSAITLANYRPINTFPYYTKPEDFKSSIYCRKSANIDTQSLQQQSYLIFQQVYNHQTVQKMILTMISQIMVLENIVEGQKIDLGELVLEDVQISMVDHLSDPTPYENCLGLCKIILKNFKAVLLPTIKNMFGQISNLYQQETRGQHIIITLIDISLFLPSILDETEIPLDQVQKIMTILFQHKNYRYLARVIRKFFSFFRAQTQRNCLDLLVNIVSEPISTMESSQVVYQAALALKTCIADTYDFDGVSEQLLLPCIANLLRIIKDRQFISNPTLLWPIINLVIRLINCIAITGQADSTSILTINELAPLLYSPNNEQMTACALIELQSCIINVVFKKIKGQFPLQGQMHQPTGAQNLNHNTLFILQTATVMIKNNLHNHALQNYDTVYRFWLTLLRHYPTLHQQSIYGFQISKNNSMLQQLFEEGKDQLLEDSVVYLQIIEEMYLIGLLQLDKQKVSDLITKYLLEPEEEQKRSRILLSTVSLYLSFALTQGHVPELLIFFLRELIGLKNKVSPSINGLRCFLYQAINYYLLTTSTAQAYQLFTNAFGGNFIDWLQPFIFSMQYTVSKQTSKINTTSILKAISELGPETYAKMMVTPRQNQIPMDWVLRIITAKLEPIEEPSNHSYDSVYKTIIPNEMTPDFISPKLRKIHLQFHSPLMIEMLKRDLRDSFKDLFNQMFAVLNWGGDDLEERVGYGAAANLSALLGWQKIPFQI